MIITTQNTIQFSGSNAYTASIITDANANYTLVISGSSTQNTGDVIARSVIKTASGSVSRSGDNITQITTEGGRTLTITRDINNQISSVSDGTRTYTFNRTGSGQITSWTVI